MKGAQHRAVGVNADADRSELAEQSQPPKPVKNLDDESGVLALAQPPAMAWWFASQYAVPPGVPLATVHISPNLVESAGSSQQYALAVIVAVTELLVHVHPMMSS